MSRIYITNDIAQKELNIPNAGDLFQFIVKNSSHFDSYMERWDCIKDTPDCNTMWIEEMDAEKKPETTHELTGVSAGITNGTLDFVSKRLIGLQLEAENRSLAEQLRELLTSMYYPGGKELVYIDIGANGDY